jgi:hypothetical protein
VNFRFYINAYHQGEISVINSIYHPIQLTYNLIYLTSNIPFGVKQNVRKIRIPTFKHWRLNQSDFCKNCLKPYLIRRKSSKTFVFTNVSLSEIRVSTKAECTETFESLRTYQLCPLAAEVSNRQQRISSLCCYSNHRLRRIRPTIKSPLKSVCKSVFRLNQAKDTCCSCCPTATSFCHWTNTWKLDACQHQLSTRCLLGRLSNRAACKIWGEKTHWIIEGLLHYMEWSYFSMNYHKMNANISIILVRSLTTKGQIGTNSFIPNLFVHFVANSFIPNLFIANSFIPHLFLS